MDQPKKRAYELHKQGKSYSEIGEALNIGKSTAFGWIKEFEVNERYFKRTSNAPDVRSSGAFGTFRTENVSNAAANESEHTPIPRQGKVRVKEPAYVSEQRERIAELEEQTRRLTKRLTTNQQKQIALLKRRYGRIEALIEEQDGEIWSIDELQDTVSQLEMIREELLDVDSNQQEWLESNLNPLIFLLEGAVESLTDDDLDEGEVYFYEE